MKKTQSKRPKEKASKDRTIPFLKAYLNTSRKELPEEHVSVRCFVLDCLLHPILKHALKGNERALDFAFTWSSLFADALQFRMQYAPTKHLKELFENEYMFAWPIVNGKPAFGCPTGNKIMRRGKHQFDTLVTDTVANALQEMHRERLHGIRSAESIRVWSEYCPERRLIYDLNPEINALPPLSTKTRNAWWVLLRRIIKSNPELSEAELDRFKKWTAYETDKEAVEQFLKKCKQRFFALCPDA